MANFADEKIPIKIARMVHKDVSTRKVLRNVKNKAKFPMHIVKEEGYKAHALKSELIDNQRLGESKINPT